MNTPIPTFWRTWLHKRLVTYCHAAALPEWGRNDPRRSELIARRCANVDEIAQCVREIHESGGRDRRRGLPPASIESIGSTRSTYPEIAANAGLTLLTVACTLLDRQLAALSRAFERDGGFTERLYRSRQRARRRL